MWGPYAAAAASLRQQLPLSPPPLPPLAPLMLLPSPPLPSLVEAMEGPDVLPLQHSKHSKLQVATGLQFLEDALRHGAAAINNCRRMWRPPMPSDAAPWLDAAALEALNSTYSQHLAAVSQKTGSPDNRAAVFGDAVRVWAPFGPAEAAAWSYRAAPAVHQRQLLPPWIGQSPAAVGVQSDAAAASAAVDLRLAAANGHNAAATAAAAAARLRHSQPSLLRRRSDQSLGRAEPEETAEAHVGADGVAAYSGAGFGSTGAAAASASRRHRPRADDGRERMLEPLDADSPRSGCVARRQPRLPPPRAGEGELLLPLSYDSGMPLDLSERATARDQPPGEMTCSGPSCSGGGDCCCRGSAGPSRPVAPPRGTAAAASSGVAAGRAAAGASLLLGVSRAAPAVVPENRPVGAKLGARAKVTGHRVSRSSEIDPKWLLPFKHGWRRLVVLRNPPPEESHSSLGGGTEDGSGRRARSAAVIADAYYFPPSTNMKLRSLPQVLAYLAKHPTEDLGAGCFTFLRRPVFGPPHEIVRNAGRSARGGGGCQRARQRPMATGGSGAWPMAEASAGDEVTAAIGSGLRLPPSARASGGAGPADEGEAAIVPVGDVMADASGRVSGSAVTPFASTPAAAGETEDETREGCGSGMAVTSSPPDLPADGAAAGEGGRPGEGGGSSRQQSSSEKAAAVEPVAAEVSRAREPEPESLAGAVTAAAVGARGGEQEESRDLSAAAGAADSAAPAAEVGSAAAEAEQPHSEDSPVAVGASQQESLVPTEKRLLDEQKTGGCHVAPSGSRKKFRASAEARRRAEAYLAEVQRSEALSPPAAQQQQQLTTLQRNSRSAPNSGHATAQSRATPVQDALSSRQNPLLKSADPCSKARIRTLTEDLRARVLRREGRAGVIIGPHHFARRSLDAPLIVDLHEPLPSHEDAAAGGSRSGGGSGSGAAAAAPPRHLTATDPSSPVTRSFVFLPAVLKRLNHKFPVVILLRDDDVIVEQESEVVAVITLPTCSGDSVQLAAAVVDVPLAMFRVMGDRRRSARGAAAAVDAVADCCLLRILRNLPTKNRLSASSVCRRWRSLCRASELWQTLSLSGLCVTDWRAALTFAQQRGVKCITFDCSRPAGGRTDDQIDVRTDDQVDGGRTGDQIDGRTGGGQTDDRSAGCRGPVIHSLVLPPDVVAAGCKGDAVAACRAIADLIYSSFQCEVPAASPAAGSAWLGTTES